MRNAFFLSCHISGIKRLLKSQLRRKVDELKDNKLREQNLQLFELHSHSILLQNHCLLLGVTRTVFIVSPGFADWSESTAVDGVAREELEGPSVAAPRDG